MTNPIARYESSTTISDPRTTAQNTLRGEVLTSALYDWVPLVEVDQIVRERGLAHSETERYDLVAATVRSLFDYGRVGMGGLPGGRDSHPDWGLSTEDAVERLERRDENGCSCGSLPRILVVSGALVGTAWPERCESHQQTRVLRLDHVVPHQIGEAIGERGLPAPSRPSMATRGVMRGSWVMRSAPWSSTARAVSEVMGCRRRRACPCR